MTTPRTIRLTNGSVTTGLNADHISTWRYDTTDGRLQIWLTHEDDAMDFYDGDARLLVDWLKGAYVELK